MRAFRRVFAAGAAAGVVALMACGGGEGEQEEMAEQAEPQREMPAETAQPSAADQEMQLPEGVTAAMIEEGRQIFTGEGLCYACHGQDGTGLPNLGANLTDDEWIHIDGSYESIAQNIMTGVTADESTTGTPMPPKGGSQITDEQVSAVAAYVWSLSHSDQ